MYETLNILSPIKCVKQYCFSIEDNAFNEIETLCEGFARAQNHFYNKFYCFKYYGSLNFYSIRNQERKYHKERFGIPQRYWIMALQKSLANLKTLWENYRQSLISHAYKNESLSEEEKSFVLHCLRHKRIFRDIVIRNIYSIQEIAKKHPNVKNHKKLISHIRRIFRKHKPKKPVCKKKRSLLLDETMYAYENGYINIRSLTPRNRISLKVNSNGAFKGNIEIIKHDGYIAIHKAKTLPQMPLNEAPLEKTNNVIGLDLNYKNIFGTSTNNTYEEGINTLQTKHTNKLKELNRNRNKLRSHLRNLKEEKRFSKALNIEKNNLGDNKYQKLKHKQNEEFKKIVNTNINRFFEAELPDTIVIEDLTFVSTKPSKYRKDTKHLLSSWQKGYIRQRLIYKASIKGINILQVNAAYTSQTCSGCGSLGERKGDMFHCPVCGKGVLSEINAAHNVAARAYNGTIAVKTSPREALRLHYKSLTQPNGYPTPFYPERIKSAVVPKAPAP